MEEAGVIAKQTMRAFDEMRPTPVADLTPDEIREIRLNEQASQWERGEKHPRGMSLKLLTLVANNGLQAVA